MGMLNKICTGFSAKMMRKPAAIVSNTNVAVCPSFTGLTYSPSRAKATHYDDAVTFGSGGSAHARANGINVF